MAYVSWDTQEHCYPNAGSQTGVGPWPLGQDEMEKPEQGRDFFFLTKVSLI